MFYNIAIHLFRFLLQSLSLFDEKIRKGVKGRKVAFDHLESNLNANQGKVWFHCASLGEFEQGMPVFEAIRKEYPQFQIILSFFSPSGYEVKQSTNVADIVVYLPLDTAKNAKRWVSLVNPLLTVFVKYDIWPNYLLELKRQQLPSILISARFRKEQIYFKWFGGTLKTGLQSFNHIFLQDNESRSLLEKIGYNEVTITGDTRFDRVSKRLGTEISLPWLEKFKGDDKLIVFGSTWPEDEKLVFQLILDFKDQGVKFLIAPHEIDDKHIATILAHLDSEAQLFSDFLKGNLSNFPSQVVILNSIGHLAATYSYADIAYVGGAVGKTGLHNILEPAVFGIPILIGPNYRKFPEAITMKNNAGVLSFNSYGQLKKYVRKLIIDVGYRKKLGSRNKNFVKNNKGAVVQIMDHIRIYFRF